MKQVTVVAGVIKKNDQFLVARRKSDCLVAAGKWEYPGGKIEFGETAENALVRELTEELGCTVKPLLLLCASSHVYSPQSQSKEQQKDSSLHVILISYLCEIFEGKPKALACPEIKWVTKSQLLDLEFCEADKKTTDTLLRI